MFSQKTVVLFFLFVICTILQKTLSLENAEQIYIDPVSDDAYAIDSKYPYAQLYPMIDKNMPSFGNIRRSESAEKYFGWAGKTQRPVEYLRGKRFWLFAKKDDGGVNAEVIPPIHVPTGSLTQGLWRSGIVGRRRRR